MSGKMERSLHKSREDKDRKKSLSRLRPLPVTKVKEILMEKLILNGQMPLFRHIMREKLYQSGWVYEYRKAHMEYIKKRGVENTNVSHMMTDMIPIGKALFNESPIRKQLHDILMNYALMYFNSDPSSLVAPYTPPPDVVIQYQSKDVKPEPRKRTHSHERSYSHSSRHRSHNRSKSRNSGEDKTAGVSRIERAKPTIVSHGVGPTSSHVSGFGGHCSYSSSHGSGYGSSQSSVLGGHSSGLSSVHGSSHGIGHGSGHSGHSHGHSLGHSSGRSKSPIKSSSLRQVTQPGPPILRKERADTTKQLKPILKPKKPPPRPVAKDVKSGKSPPRAEIEKKPVIIEEEEELPDI